MDQDTTRSRNAFNRIIKDFESGQTDILIGTQMISKGLDFENLTVVGILNADSMLNFPDFRAHERAFQMMSQVSGRAGRRQKHGKVVIQTSDPRNKIIRLVLRNDFEGMYNSQIEERKSFNYPPFCRLIKITIRCRDRSRLEEISSKAGEELRRYFGSRVMGPEYPLVSRVQLWYIKSIIIKIEREKPFIKAREAIAETIGRIEKTKEASAVRFSVDVDPY
jgi:primosomal protein N' (replication factor Y)